MSSSHSAPCGGHGACCPLLALLVSAALLAGCQRPTQQLTLAFAGAPDEPRAPAGDDLVGATAEVLRARLAALGVNGAVAIAAGRQLVVTAPAGEDAARITDALTRRPAIEIRLLWEVRSEAFPLGAYAIALAGPDDAPRFTDEATGAPVDTAEVLAGAPVIVTAAGFSRAATARLRADGAPALDLRLTDQGLAQMRQASTENRGAHAALLLDRKLVSTLTFRVPVTGAELSIESAFEDLAAAQALAAAIAGGPLPAPLRRVDEGA